MFGVGITGNFVSALKSIEKRRERVEKVPGKTLDQAAHAGESMAKKLVRVKTGALRASIDVYKHSEHERHIGPKKWYGIVIEKGRKGFCASGVNSGLKRGSVISGTSINHAQMLRFKGRNGWVFTRCVKGSKPYPFMEPTYKYLRVYFPALMKSNMRKALD